MCGYCNDTGMVKLGHLPEPCPMCRESMYLDSALKQDVPAKLIEDLENVDNKGYSKRRIPQERVLLRKSGRMDRNNADAGLAV